MSDEKKMPVATGNSFGVSTAVWDNKNKKGEDYQSVSVSISVKQQDGTYKTRNTLYPKDIDNLIVALTELQTNAKAKGIVTGFIAKE